MAALSVPSPLPSPLPSSVPSFPAPAEPALESLLPRLERAAARTGAVTFLGSAGTDGRERVEWGRLHEDAQAMAAALQARGVGPGDHVALLGPTSRAFVTAIQATWLAGATVVCLPLPMRLGSIEEFVAQTRARIQIADARIVLVDPQLAPFVTEEPGDPPIVGLDALTGRASAWDRPADDPTALAILQFTSGSTSDPKGVMLPHHCLVANIDAIVEGAGLGPDDTGVSWLPLYHDMGLIGLLMTPMTTGFDLAIASPQDFLAAPGDWMRWISEFRGTITCGPNFAYVLAARALRRLDGIDLSSWRLALNGAEPIDPAAVEAFTRGRIRARARREVAVLRLRHGRGHARDLVPPPGYRDGRRLRRPRGTRARAGRPTGRGRRRPPARAPRPHACAASSCGCATPTRAASSATARSVSSSCGAAR